MIVKMNSRINLPKGELPPDDWAVGVDLQLDLVVSRNNKGEITSRAGDLVWDLTCYHAHKQTTKLYFDYWQNVPNRKINLSNVSQQRWVRIRELQLLMCNVLYIRGGAEINIASLHQLQFILRKLALFTENVGCNVLELLGREELLDMYVAQIPDRDAAYVRNLLNLFYSRSPEEFSFPIARTKFWNEISQRAIRHEKSIKQHAPLPTRIYSGWINRLDAELTVIENNLDQLVKTLHIAVKAWREADAKRNGLHSVVVGPNLFNCDLMADLFKRYGKPRSLVGLSSIVHVVYLICKLQIHTFTGMRDREVIYLPFHCLKSEGRNGRKYALIQGITTKLSGGRKRRAEWVTTEETAFRAISIAQALSSVIYESIGINPSKNDGDKDTYRLFISSEYLPWNDRHQFDKSEALPFNVARNLRLSNESLMFLEKILLPTIEEEDIIELEEIDPFRDWRIEDEFKAGMIWPLKSHQLRRSLALYARASGCVRISSLRRQLQHISNEMSTYYANGSTFAKNFFDEDPKGFNNHVIKQWQNSEDEAELLAFVRDVLKSEEPLYGGAGNFYFSQKRNGNLITREQAQAAIKSGTMSYKTTPLGGCTKLGQCEKTTGISFINTACATENCKNLIGKHSRIIQVINAKRRMIEHLNSDSIAYKVELEDLVALEEVEIRWKLKVGQDGLESGGKHV